MSDRGSRVGAQMKPAKTYEERKQAAFAAGRIAFKEGNPVTDCPIKKHKGLARAWSEGWQAAKGEREKQSSGMYIARPPLTSPVEPPKQTSAA